MNDEDNYILIFADDLGHVKYFLGACVTTMILPG